MLCSVATRALQVRASCERTCISRALCSGVLPSKSRQLASAPALQQGGGQGVKPGRGAVGAGCRPRHMQSAREAGRQAAPWETDASSSHNSLQEQFCHVYVPRLHHDVEGGLVQGLQLRPTAAGRQCRHAGVGGMT